MRGAPTVVSILVVALTAASLRAEEPEELRTDSRAPYLHRLTLYDEDGTVISPDDPAPAPYSPRATCGKCHAYDTIGRGWHFNAGGEGVQAGPAGEPWLLVDARLGIQLPISARAWPGTSTPDEVGLSRWEFLLSFGRHLPGGGSVEPGPGDMQEDPEALRWRISGGLQIDCLICHSADGRHDQAEAARQIEKENFKWIPTAAAGLAVVRGEARNCPDDWDPYMPPDPDYPEQAGPTLVYDKTKFDPDDRVFFNVTGTPHAERCYFCHTVREVGGDAPDSWQMDRDVHLAAGLTCVDCHRHGLDHAITRDYEREAEDRAGQTETELTVNLSCRGCHLGDEEEAESTTGAVSGRLGAPYPEHRGLPALHLEELACTACHSGPKPRGAVRRFQTARAHGLGLTSKERNAATLPEIYGPVFVRGEDGKIAPHLMLWPAYWAVVSKEGVWQIPPEQLRPVMDVAPAEPCPPDAEEPFSYPPLTAEQIAVVLARLGAELNENAYAVYVRRGTAYRLGGAGQLAPVERDGWPTDSAYTWPMAHDVRPAAQALGVGGCTDCHAADAPFTFGSISPVTAAQAERPPLEFMYQLRGESRILSKVWASSFAQRPWFKFVCFACVIVLAGVLHVYGLAAFAALLRQSR